MSIIVNTNSYITVLEADALVASLYISTDPSRVAWNALEDADKGVLLVRSLKELERLRVTGCKTDITQVLAFPRNANTVVPDLVKEAQVVNALAILTTASSVTGSPVSRGVSSYSIDDLSETFAKGAEVTLLVTSSEARRMMWVWTSGGFDII